LERFVANQRDLYHTNPSAASDLIPADAGKFAPADLAAWTAVSRVLFNLDDFMTRE
jgi:hypothetical protein